ncbi:MAG: hypothetical protein C5B50_02120 [Verrucomicrobia bacterium]|nr:MAG: hypothetical protein C5B50_02120 [Verrucomicrobiota bacterium]
MMGYTMKKLAIILISVVAVALISAGILIAAEARRHQIAGAQMPNWKGSQMSPSDGYLIAGACGAISLVWILTARQRWRMLHKNRQSSLLTTAEEGRNT